MEKWYDEILEGMKMIKRGCEKNHNWENCADCPFDPYCTVVMTALNDLTYPSDWFEEKEEPS